MTLRGRWTRNVPSDGGSDEDLSRSDHDIGVVAQIGDDGFANTQAAVDETVNKTNGETQVVVLGETQCQQTDCIH